jgi:short-subunit dehydrogenase
LRDKVIVISGASSGIGAATAIACAQAGMHVALGARRLDKLRDVAAQVEQLGRRALVCVCDVDRDDEVARFIAAAERELQRIDVCFANAGYGLVSPVLETSDAQVRAIFETNVYGTLRLMRAALPVMRRTSPQPHLVVCSSSASEIAPPLYGVYAATKAAQDSMTQALRVELHAQGIAVSSVHPVGTRTEFFARAHRNGHDESADPIQLNTPTMLMQSPQHVARRIVACLRRPRPEVWPSPLTRYGVALCTAFPSLADWALRRMFARRDARRDGE